jgi:hypothetical protein
LALQAEPVPVGRGNSPDLGEFDDGLGGFGEVGRSSLLWMASAPQKRLAVGRPMKVSGAVGAAADPAFVK